MTSDIRSIPADRRAHILTLSSSRPMHHSGSMNLKHRRAIAALDEVRTQTLPAEPNETQLGALGRGEVGLDGVEGPERPGALLSVVRTQVRERVALLSVERVGVGNLEEPTRCLHSLFK